MAEKEKTYAELLEGDKKAISAAVKFFGAMKLGNDVENVRLEEIVRDGNRRTIVLGYDIRDEWTRKREYKQFIVNGRFEIKQMTVFKP